jgi:hypothetical protein
MPSNIEELKKIEKILPILLTDKVKRKLLSLITLERKETVKGFARYCIEQDRLNELHWTDAEKVAEDFLED